SLLLHHYFELLTTFDLHSSYCQLTSVSIYTLSLHDALPILPRRFMRNEICLCLDSIQPSDLASLGASSTIFLQSKIRQITRLYRSEEHTSELQSRFDLVCRLLIEKKK